MDASDEQRILCGVYYDMRLVCVGRHAFLSDHLCRYFRELGAQCEPAVGVANAVEVAGMLEPHLVVAESDLLTAQVLDAWSHEGVLRDVPVLAVSFTRRPEEFVPAGLSGLAGVIYLPTLARRDALALLEGACQPKGVDMPVGATLPASRQSAPTR